jgi:hypothetical protein
LGQLHRRGAEPPSSDDDGSLSESDPDLGSSNDDGYPSAGEQGGSSTRKYSPWSIPDEQRLLAFKKEGKPWKWIFRKFPEQNFGRSTHAPDHETAPSRIVTHTMVSLRNSAKNIEKYEDFGDSGSHSGNSAAVTSSK